VFTTDCQADVPARNEATIETVSVAFTMPKPLQSIVSGRRSKRFEVVWQYGRIRVLDGSRAKLREALVSETTPSLACAGGKPDKGA
jgi:hypothetical protein